MSSYIIKFNYMINCSVLIITHIESMCQVTRIQCYQEIVDVLVCMSEIP